MKPTPRTLSDLENLVNVGWLIWKAGRAGRDHQRAAGLLDQAAVQLREILAAIEKRRNPRGH